MSSDETEAAMDRAFDALRQIARIIEDVDNRCAAHDGPVGNTRQEMTDAEMRLIYKYATGEF